MSTGLNALTEQLAKDAARLTQQVAELTQEMDALRAAGKQALEALETGGWNQWGAAILALRAALEPKA